MFRLPEEPPVGTTVRPEPDTGERYVRVDKSEAPAGVCHWRIVVRLVVPDERPVTLHVPIPGTWTDTRRDAVLQSVDQRGEQVDGNYPQHMRLHARDTLLVTVNGPVSTPS